MNSSHPAFPIATIASIDQLLAIAVGVEHEAARRYDQLSAVMDQRGEAALAATFRRLAALERGHEDGLARWAAREGMAPPLPAVFAWRLPETFGGEAEARALTPGRALDIAVENEEMAFTFYTTLATMAEDPLVRLRAEGLAREELEHVHHLRAMRRQAVHLGGPVPRSAPRPRDRDDLAALAGGLEQASAQLDQALSAVLAAQGEPHAAALLAHQAGAARLRAARFAHMRPGPGSPTAQAAEATGLLQPGNLTADGALRLSLRDAEEIAEAYMAAAEQADDPTLADLARDLAEEAMARLAVVRSLAG